MRRLAEPEPSSRGISDELREELGWLDESTAFESLEVKQKAQNRRNALVSGVLDSLRRARTGVVVREVLDGALDPIFNTLHATGRSDRHLIMTLVNKVGIRSLRALPFFQHIISKLLTAHEAQLAMSNLVSFDSSACSSSDETSSECESTYESSDGGDLNDEHRQASKLHRTLLDAAKAVTHKLDDQTSGAADEYVWPLYHKLLQCYGCKTLAETVLDQFSGRQDVSPSAWVELARYCTSGHLDPAPTALLKELLNAAPRSALPEVAAILCECRDGHVRASARAKLSACASKHMHPKKRTAALVENLVHLVVSPYRETRKMSWKWIQRFRSRQSKAGRFATTLEPLLATAEALRRDWELYNKRGATLGLNPEIAAIALVQAYSLGMEPFEGIPTADDVKLRAAALRQISRTGQMESTSTNRWMSYFSTWSKYYERRVRCGANAATCQRVANHLVHRAFKRAGPVAFRAGWTGSDDSGHAVGIVLNRGQKGDAWNRGYVRVINTGDGLDGYHPSMKLRPQTRKARLFGGRRSQTSDNCVDATARELEEILLKEGAKMPQSQARSAARSLHRKRRRVLFYGAAGALADDPGGGGAAPYLGSSPWQAFAAARRSEISRRLAVRKGGITLQQRATYYRDFHVEGLTETTMTTCLAEALQIDAREDVAYEAAMAAFYRAFGAQLSREDLSALGFDRAQTRTILETLAASKCLVELGKSDTYKTWFVRRPFQRRFAQHPQRFAQRLLPALLRHRKRATKRGVRQSEAKRGRQHHIHRSRKRRKRQPTLAIARAELRIKLTLLHTLLVERCNQRGWLHWTRRLPDSVPAKAEKESELSGYSMAYSGLESDNKS